MSPFELIRLKSFHTVFQYLLQIPIRGMGRFLMILSKLWLPTPRFPCVFPTIYSINLISHESFSHLEHYIFTTGSHEQGCLDWLKHLKNTKGSIIDVGANVGFYSLFFETLLNPNEKVYAFEAHPKNCEKFIENTHLNNSRFIQLFNVAVSNHNQECTLNENPLDNDNGGYSVKHHTDNLQSSIKVEGKRLDDIEEIKNDVIKLIKLDIEGYELEALQGAMQIIKQHRPILVIEISHTDHQGPKKISELLTQLSYDIYQLSKGKQKKGKLIKVKSIQEVKSSENIICISGNKYSKI